MKKLKTFSVQDAIVLSRKEMAAIEGGLIIDALDTCSLRDHVGKPCILYTGLDADGRSYLVLGKCYIGYEQVGSQIKEKPIECV